MSATAATSVFRASQSDPAGDLREFSSEQFDSFIWFLRHLYCPYFFLPKMNSLPR